MNSKIVPIVLCGGSGSRLWPSSRLSMPKQYLALNPEINNTFLQNTVLRLNGLNNLENPIVICNEEHKFIAADQLRQINIKAKSILLEPFGRNTAPAIALAALRILEDGNDSLLLVVPSDHKVDQPEIFLKIIEAAKLHAYEGKLIAFGINPRSPETGYGYIQSEKPLISNSCEGEKIEKFIEKPPSEIARNLIKDSKYSWNSGIYLFKASTIINQLKKFSPEVIKYCEAAMKERKKDLYFENINKKEFSQCPNISIDNSVMEKTNLGIVFSLEIGWSDIGGWKSYWENSSKDKNGNSVQGNAIAISTKNCLLKSEKRLVVGLGIEDMLVIETNDAVLISKKSYSEKVKDLVNSLKDKKKKEGAEHTKGYRPWGNYIVIEEGPKWKVKKIEVNPNASLSLQMHKHRSEHWVIVSGIAKITIDDKTFELNPNESCFVPKEKKHRLANPSTSPLIIFEVQIGTYLEEDDIYRYDDNYGRKI